MKSPRTIALGAITAIVIGTLVGPISTRAQEATSPESSDDAALSAPANLPAVEPVPTYAPFPDPRPATGATSTTISAPVAVDPVGGYIGGGRKTIHYEMAPAARSIQAIRDAAAALRDAETEEDKTKAKQQLTQRVEQYFDEDMQRREADLAKIEERLRKLREQLELRQAKKQEIINLQIQVAVNEAEGLGFFSQPAEEGGRGKFLPAVSSPLIPRLPNMRPVP